MESGSPSCGIGESQETTHARSLASPSRAEPSRAEPIHRRVGCGRDFLYLFENRNALTLMATVGLWSLYFWPLKRTAFWSLMVTVGLWTSGNCWPLVSGDCWPLDSEFLAIKGTEFCFFWLLPQYSSTVFVVVSGDLHPGEARVRSHRESRPPEPSSSKACTSEDE